MHFYFELYKRKMVYCDTFTTASFNGLPKVAKDSQFEMDKARTLLELQQALMNKRNGKSPRIDGLPAEFYKVFWSRKW